MSSIIRVNHENISLIMKTFLWNLTSIVAPIFQNSLVPKGRWDFEDTQSVELQLFNAFADILQCPKIDKTKEERKKYNWVAHFTQIMWTPMNRQWHFMESDWTFRDFRAHEVFHTLIPIPMGGCCHVRRCPSHWEHWGFRVLPKDFSTLIVWTTNLSSIHLDAVSNGNRVIKNKNSRQR